MQVGFSPQQHPEWLNKLFLIRPNYATQITFDPSQGPKDVVNAFVVILDLIDPATNKPTVIDGASIGGAALVPQLRDKIDSLVLGRLEMSAAQAGKNPAYKLNPNFTPEDENLGSRWLQELGPVPPLPTPPAPAPVQPQVSPWAAPSTAPAPQPGQWGQAPQGAPQPPPADVWAGTNAAPAQPSWGQVPAAPAPAQPPVPAAPAPQPGQWGGAPAQPQQPVQAPVAAPAQQGWGAAPAAPQNATQDPALVAQLQARGIQVTGDMDNATLQMIANSLPAQ